MFIMYIKMMSENPDRSDECLRSRQNGIEAFLSVCYIFYDGQEPEKYIDAESKRKYNVCTDTASE